MPTEPIMTVVDGEERWTRVLLGRRELTAGMELTVTTRRRYRFLYATGKGQGRIFHCDDPTQPTVPQAELHPAAVVTVHNTVKLHPTEETPPCTP